MPDDNRRKKIREKFSAKRRQKKHLSAPELSEAKFSM